jgi:hypothetical protein
VRGGKTTTARALVRDRRGLYLSWDKARDRRSILRENFDRAPELWVFDELHEFRRWRGFLKGLHDTHHEAHRILVTGSARLDLYGRGGDSLQGRYFAHHLHPLTVSEVAGRTLVPLDHVPDLPRDPVPATS